MNESEIKSEADFLNVCRICLQSGEQDELEMISIYERDSMNDQILLYEKIEQCGGIKILTDPELPTRICKKCNAFLTIAHKFRVICTNSDNYLREFVCKPADKQQEPEEDEMIEYLVDEFIPETNGETLPPGAVSVTHMLQQAGHDIAEDGNELEPYEELDQYSEVMWLQDEGTTTPEDGEHTQEFEEHVQEVDVGQENYMEEIIDQKHHNTSNTSPSKKTLGISLDGTAIIRIKPSQQMIRDRQMHICEICGNSYNKKFALENHMRRHRNERPFECEICAASFHCNFQLTRHIRKHTGRRPFTCQYCQRTFADRSTMVKHERIHRNERPFTCETCGKSFTYSSVLKVHMMTHSGEKPFTCGICHKRFARAHHLRAHLETMLHSNDPRSKVLLTQIRKNIYDEATIQDVTVFYPPKTEVVAAKQES